MGVCGGVWGVGVWGVVCGEVRGVRRVVVDASARGGL